MNQTKMTRSQAGREGARVTNERWGAVICFNCGHLMSTGFKEENGQKGGNETFRRYGSEFFSEIGKQGGRGNKKGG